jgi:hypothetical protein
MAALRRFTKAKIPVQTLRPIEQMPEGGFEARPKIKSNPLFHCVLRADSNLPRLLQGLAQAILEDAPPEFGIVGHSNGG